MKRIKDIYFEFKNLSIFKKLVCAIAAVLFFVYIIRASSTGGDFRVFLHASRQLRDLQNIYSEPFIDGLHYFYSPFFAFVLLPFSYFPKFTFLLWGLFSGFLLFRIWYLIRHQYPKNSLTKSQIWIWGAISFFCVSRFILYNLSMVQMTIFILWGILESLRLANENKNLKAGIILGLMINIKILPIVILPYLIYRRKMKFLFFTCITLILCFFIPSLYLGWDFNLSLHQAWFEEINPSDKEFLIETERHSQSLVGVIPVFITETFGDLPFKRHVIELGFQNAIIITQVFRALFVIFTLYFLRKPFRNIQWDLYETRALAYILLITPLIFPHQQKYAFVFALPAIAYLIYFILKLELLKKRKLGLVFLLLLVLGTPIISSDVIGRNAYNFLDHYRFVGLSLIVLTLILAFSSPKKLEKREYANVF